MIESKYINPFTDFGFKLLFGSEQGKLNMIYFINSLELVEEKVVDITYLDKELQPDRPADRSAIYDVFCTTDRGSTFIVEMQNRLQDSFIARSLYYVSYAIANQGRKGRDWYYELTPVYYVACMNFVIPELGDSFRVDAAITDLATHRILTGLCHYTFLQMPLCKSDPLECDTELQKLFYVMTNMETMTSIPWRENIDLERLSAMAQRAGLSERDNYLYEESLKQYRDNQNVLRTAYRHGVEEGIEQGIEKGMAQGLEKGMAQGRLEERVSLINMLLANGLSLEQVKLYLGLTDEDISELGI